jgi:hypothetical protein
MTPDDFQSWMKHMRFTRYGGQQAAAEALGVSAATIRNWSRGAFPDGTPVSYPVQLDLAMAAVSSGLKPWSEQTGDEKIAARERIGL